MDDRMARRPGLVGTALIIAGVLALVGVGFVAFSPGVDTTPPPPQGLADALQAPGSAQASGSGAADQSPAPSPPLPAPSTTGPSPTVRPAQLVPQVIQLINAARLQAGRAPVQTNGRLRNAAQSHSSDMAKNEYLGHVDGKGLDAAARMVKAGYSQPLGENLAKGYPSASDLVQWWLSQPEFRTNLLDPSAVAVGVAVAIAKNGDTYWTADFGA